MHMHTRMCVCRRVEPSLLRTGGHANTAFVCVTHWRHRRTHSTAALCDSATAAVSEMQSHAGSGRARPASMR